MVCCLSSPPGSEHEVVAIHQVDADPGVVGNVVMETVHHPLEIFPLAFDAAFDCALCGV